MGCKNSKKKDLNNVISDSKPLIQNKENIDIKSFKYALKYDENELMTKLKSFLDKVIIQDLIFDIPRSLKDSVFDMINEKEKEKLIEYLNKEKNNFINDILNYLQSSQFDLLPNLTKILY